MSEPAEAVDVTAPPGSMDSGDDELSRVLGLRPPAVRILREAGYATPEAVQALDDARLKELGLETEDIDRIRHPAPSDASRPGGSTAEGERGVERWMDRVRTAERPRRRAVPVRADKGSASILKKWVQGDDRAMEDWIQSAEPARPAPSVTSPPSTPSPPTGTPEAPAPEAPPAAAPPAAAPIPSNLVEREETIVRWLTDLLDRVKSDQFDPASFLQEVQELHRNMFEEQAKRRQLEEELEHVKRGSIAVIKYVRSREAKARDQAIQAKDAEIAELKLKILTHGSEPAAAAPTPAAVPDGEAAPGAPEAPGNAKAAERRIREELQARETQFNERETELRRRIVQLEAEIRNLRAEAGAVLQREELRKQPGEQLSENLTKMMSSADARERELVLRENELRTRFEEIRLATEDHERKRGLLNLRERELETWESQLATARQAVELETRRLEQLRTEERPSGSATEEELHKLERVKIEITNKEAEMKAREAYLRQKVEELEALQRRGIEPDTERVSPNAATEGKSTKIHSGVRRLDDLLFGGFPPGSQIIVNGPAHAGKEILARLFVAEGLKQAVPAVWLVTDKTYTQIREEMTQLFPAYPEFEQKGMVRYIDLYSRSLGVTVSEPGVRLLATTDKGVLDQMSTAVNNATYEFKDKFGGYRIVFESISTLSAYLDTAALFRFLQPFAGRRKLDGAASFYLLETGMHTESDLQTIEHMMDGSINLKIDQLKTFLSVKGISEVQSRAWIGYTFSKKAFSLGSFSLDHIR